MRSRFVWLLLSLVLLLVGVSAVGFVLPAPASVVVPSLFAGVFVLGGATFCACVAARATDLPALCTVDERSEVVRVSSAKR
jgi:hypothetical protein